MSVWFLQVAISLLLCCVSVCSLLCCPRKKNSNRLELIDCLISNVQFLNVVKWTYLIWRSASNSSGSRRYHLLLHLDPFQFQIHILIRDLHTLSNSYSGHRRGDLDRLKKYKSLNFVEKLYNKMAGTSF